MTTFLPSEHERLTRQTAVFFEIVYQQNVTSFVGRLTHDQHDGRRKIEKAKLVVLVVVACSAPLLDSRLIDLRTTYEDCYVVG